jgi:hypothetical protein
MHWPLLIVFALVALRLASPPTASATLFLLAAYALTGRAQAIQALALSWLFSMLNPAIAPEGALGGLGRYAVLAGAAISVILRARHGVAGGRMPVSRLLLLTVLLGAGIVVHSLLFSAIPDVSVLKALAWTTATATLLSAWGGLDGMSRRRVAGQIFGGLVLVMMVSLPLLPTGLGYSVNGTGFQGVLAHPQAFGPTMGLLGAWAGSQVLCHRRPSWRLIGLFGVCLVLVVLSEARTAGLALLLAIAISGLSGSTLARKRYLEFMPGLRSPRLHAVVGVALFASIAGGSVLSHRVDQYLVKHGASSSLLEAYDESRGQLIDQMWENVVAHPMRGIGFGIASDPTTMTVDRDPVLGLPTAAVIEKGVLPLAVLEELGVLGFLVVACWVFAIVRRSARGGGVVAVSVSLAAFLMNMGESMLFSVGGMGLLLLILITWAATERQQVDTRLDA